MTLAAATSITVPKVERALMKWCGSKQRILPVLRTRVPVNIRSRRYLEPFAGSAALFFHMQPRVAVLSDSNARLMATYAAVRDVPEQVIEHLRLFERDHSTEAYYETRLLLNEGYYAASPSGTAAAFLYLNRTCFNGLYRENKKGEMNVPVGRYTDPKIVDAASIHQASRALQGKTLLTADYESVLDQAREGNFVYLDPPYAPSTLTANFSSYVRAGFSEEDHVRLAGWFKKLNDRGCLVMLSNSDTAFTQKLYRRWRLESVTAHRSVSAGPRGTANEIIVRNY